MQSRLADIRSRRFGLALAVLVLTSLLLPASVLAQDDEASEGESDEQSKASEEEETKEPEPEPDADDRGNRKRRWPVEQVIGRGHGLATAYYGQIFPDNAGLAGAKDSVCQLFAEEWDLNWSGGAWGSIRASTTTVSS
jgi:hypothetical protein